VLGAEVELQSQLGARRVALPELWTGPGHTSARPDELCVVIYVPTPAPRSNSAYLRLEYRRAMEIAVVGAAASVTLDEDGLVTGVRVALTAVAPTIIEVTGLSGGTVDEVADAAANAAAEQARPISDVRASDRYRRHTVGVMAGRAVHAAARRAAGEIIPIPLNRAIGIGAAT
jgi:CO/xanthine dehydrogenase FAD-binding subunit